MATELDSTGLRNRMGYVYVSQLLEAFTLLVPWVQVGAFVRKNAQQSHCVMHC